MTKDEFNAIEERIWVPVTIAGEAFPDWMRGIPEDRLVDVYASGSFANPRVIHVNGRTYEVVGGIDAYRYDPKDELLGFPINLDHYIVLIDPIDDNMLLVAGPIEQDHAWLKKMPDEKPGVTICEFKDIKS